MNTREEYVTYAQAKALKELGFDWPCRYVATNEDAPDGQYWTIPCTETAHNDELNRREFTIPTQAVVCRWLREEKGIIGCMEYIPKTQEWTVDLNRVSDNKWVYRVSIKPTYEAALSSGIDRAIELLKGGEK